MTKDEQFEITKHFAGVLSMHFHWIACHTLSDGSGIIYRPGPGLSAGVHKMSAAQVLSAGAAIELGRSKQDG